MQSNIKIGFVPTRRNLFSAEDARKYADLTRNKLNDLNVDYVDILDVNDEGLFYSDDDVDKVYDKFKEQNVDGLFFPHVNFGTEHIVARLARMLDVPVLLWGPRDEAPEENGFRLRDSQCGLFATGKVLRRFNVKFSYINNCNLSDDIFTRGLYDFLAVCNTVKSFKNIRILQIGPRPYDFFTTICNEGELLEKFNIQIVPISLSELVKEVRNMKNTELTKVESVVTHCKNCSNVEISDSDINTVGALKVAIQNLVKKYHCNCVALQCWNSLQDEIGIMPCAANSILIDEGIPVMCETDIHGVISTVLIEAANFGINKSFFADWTVRHPTNENGELLQHCGLYPFSVAKNKPTIGYPLAFESPGSVEALANDGEMTLARFDGDNGEYSLLLGHAKTIEGPITKGTYQWIEVKNLKKLEYKLVTGPYIHHVSGIYEDVLAILYEACRYIGIKADLYDDNEEEVLSYLRGE